MSHETIATYDKSAESLAEYFKGIGSRVEDVERGLDILGKTENISAVEIGCGDGRDAREIASRVSKYIGFDPSAGMLEVARRTSRGLTFVQSDALSFGYPKNVDIVYAFASLLHSQKEEISMVCAKVYEALKPGGVLYVSLKERAEYEMEVKKDRFGERVFYFYNPELIKNLSGPGFEVAHQDRQQIGDTEWFTIAMKKK